MDSLTKSPVAKFVVYAAAFVVLIAGIRAAESILVPFLLSVFITIICSPAMAWMHRKGIPYLGAILIIIATIIVAGVLIGAIVGAAINSFTADLPEYQQRLQGIYSSMLLWLEGAGIDISSTNLREVLNPGTAMSMLGNTLSSLGNLMTNAFLILLTVMFLLGEETIFYNKLRAASSSTARSLSKIEEIIHVINRYMALKTGISLLTGVLAMLLLWLVGVEYLALWGLLAFLLNFVPNLGSIIAAVPPVLLALVQLGPLEAAVVAGGFFAINLFVGSFLEPRFMGRGLDLSTLVVFLSLVFWGWVLGPVGMLLSVPLTMTVKLALESFEDTKTVAIMLGSGMNLPEAGASPSISEDIA